MSKGHADKDKEDANFVRVEYKCHRSGNIKAQGTGARPLQKYYAKECQCHVYMRFKKRGFGKNKCVITSLNLNHNHIEDLNKEFYDFHPKNRKLTDE
jgi:hypothetical protein